MNLAIIPARGGSKRIPKKNIKSFAGKPLIAHSIETAIESNCFDKIMVSTDSDEIAEVATKYGAEVPFIRPAELSDDYTGTRAVTNHAIQYYLDKGFQIEFTCCIYATAPLLQADYLAGALKQLQQQLDKAFAFSVCSFPFPVQRALKHDGDGVTPMYPEHIGSRSQDLTEAFHDAGQFYWGRTNDYLSPKGIFSPHSLPIFLPRYLVQDIDTLEDWQTAEILYKLITKTG
ncbi:pseudaminic acid cytidylyltransferase [Catenovulum sp. 2E275]|uniref:pseudaminic acid cytidylyltransferase n=1 Tax=Catenovulum sp. 2E275 TaxID=2980497 RepID=UPI0021D20920|nr:pseudaminic acid cytidylyltransferase [Catenovulum sp. 2E275]MCU4674758.1 pseudaminic acid cytidylyltransferase [Catenovulum sp. 2E275]